MRRALIASLLLSFAVNAFARDIIVRFDDPNEDAARTAAFNEAVGALPMDAADGDQVRVWFYAFWSGEIKVTGYIVTRKGVWRCVLGYKHRAEDIAVHTGGNCGGPRRNTERIDKVMALMADAALPDKEKAYCEVMDGWGASVEGMFEGRRFAFTSMNTDECTDSNPVAARVELFLQTVSGAWNRKDENDDD